MWGWGGGGGEGGKGGLYGVCTCDFHTEEMMLGNNELTHLSGEKLCNVEKERYPHFCTQLPPNPQTIETF